MAGAPSSEFLTFYRSALRAGQAVRQVQYRQASFAKSFSTSPARCGYGKAGEHSKDDKHVHDKQDEPNLQSYESQKGIKNKQQGKGSSAEREQDEHDSVSKTKKEFPEAPDTAIGMQDERGGKGN